MGPANHPTSSLQKQLLSELHKAHLAISHMKAVVCSHDIKERACGCKQCFKTRKAPQVAPLFSWSWPTAPWQRINIDLATLQSNHYLIIVDAHSKWPEVIDPMKTTTAEATANAMCNIFARYSLPKQIISDNGPLFQSAEIKEFLRQNCIQNVLISLYHPSSNGLAERFVQTFKYSLESSASDPACTLQQKIQNFLLSYRSTQHATMAHPQPNFSYTMTGMLSSEKSLLTTQSLHTTTCQGKSGNLEPWYNTPHHTLTEFT